MNLRGVCSYGEFFSILKGVKVCRRSRLRLWQQEKKRLGTGASFSCTNNILCRESVFGINV